MKLKTFLQKWFRANIDFIETQRRQRKIHRQIDIDFRKLYEKVHNESMPCFVLSTGRCGTKLLTNILNEHKRIEAYHVPSPELIYFSKYAYEQWQKKSEELEIGIDIARYELIRDVFLVDKHFVETNNRITFFSYQLAGIFPNAKFIHLVRNPIDFINSGLNRKWYTGGNLHDEGRIIPSHISNNSWKGLSQTEKIAWLWTETNQFIENFKSQIDSNRIITVKSEDLFTSPLPTREIFHFLNEQSLPEDRITHMLKTPVNESQKSHKQNIRLDEKDYETLYELSSLYGYRIMAGDESR